MKVQLLTLIFCMILTSATAQELASSKGETSYQFMPLKIELSAFNVMVKSEFNRPSKFIHTTGWLLHQLKFRSVVDEFNAIAPFDVRAFNPTSVRNFNQSLARSYLLLNSHPSFYDR